MPLGKSESYGFTFGILAPEAVPIVTHHVVIFDSDPSQE